MRIGFETIRVIPFPLFQKSGFHTKNRFYMNPLGNPVGSHITTTHKIGFEKILPPPPSRGMFRTLLKNSVYEEKRVLVFLDRVRNN